MLPLIILILNLYQNQAASLIQNSTGSLDAYGVCHCSVIYQDSTFPADRLESLEIANRNLNITVNEEITKIHNYESTVIAYMEKLKDLSRRVEVMEHGGLSYTELDFELIKLEIKEMENIILQLKTSLNGSSVTVETLYQEISNISIMVSQLEVYDKNNVLVIRRQIADLQKRLEDCQQNKSEPSLPSLPPVHYGTCEHGQVINNISKPFVVQVNWLLGSYLYGGWGRDSLPGADQSVQWVAPLKTDGRIMDVMRFYPSYNDLTIYSSATERSFTKYDGNGYPVYTDCGQGGGMIMYNSMVYFNCYNTLNICKYDWNKKVLTRVPLPNATYTNRFSYSQTAWQDIDCSGDEEGLWVIYSTEVSNGNIVISKLNVTNLAVLQTWHTSQYKSGVSNAFMACGVLYATRAINTQQGEIFYMYDTKTNEEGKLSIIFNKPKERVQSMSYNCNDHRLYMFNDAFLVYYDLSFTLPSKPTSNITQSNPKIDEPI